MRTRFRLTKKFKNTVKESDKPQYLLAQDAGLDRGMFYLFMNGLAFSEYHLEKVLKIAESLGISEDEGVKRLS